MWRLYHTPYVRRAKLLTFRCQISSGRLRAEKKILKPVDFSRVIQKIKRGTFFETHARLHISATWFKPLVIFSWFSPGLEKRFFFTKKWVLFFKFLYFNLQMPDTKLQPTSTMKSKDKSSEQRFGNVNATNRNVWISFLLS